MPGPRIPGSSVRYSPQYQWIRVSSRGTAAELTTRIIRAARRAGVLSGPPGMPRASRNTRNTRNGPGKAPGLFRVLCARKDPERDPERPGKTRKGPVNHPVFPWCSPAALRIRYRSEATCHACTHLRENR